MKGTCKVQVRDAGRAVIATAWLLAFLRYCNQAADMQAVLLPLSTPLLRTIRTLGSSSSNLHTGPKPLSKEKTLQQNCRHSQLWKLISACHLNQRCPRAPAYCVVGLGCYLSLHSHSTRLTPQFVPPSESRNLNPCSMITVYTLLLPLPAPPQGPSTEYSVTAALRSAVESGSTMSAEVREDEMR